MTLPPLLFQGSVKDILGVEGESPYLFSFSDRYSLFDWGEMPDTIPHKGDCLAKMSALLFTTLEGSQGWQQWQPTVKLSETQEELLTKLCANGVPHHYIKESSYNQQESNLMAVKPVTIVRPSYDKKTNMWDYQNFSQGPKECLVPLEVIFRFGVPKGSSLTKRVDSKEYCQEIGLAKKPKEGDRFAKPVIEFSTKLEQSDRYLSYQEATEIAGMSESEFTHLANLTALIAMRLKDIFLNHEIELWDGKFEFAFVPHNGSRTLMLVDAIGPDELRLIYRDVQLSKESMRAIYRSTPWCAAIDTAKEMAKKRGSKEWKSICLDELKSSPHSLTKEQIETISAMYQNLANQLSKQLGETPSFNPKIELDQVADRLRGLQ
jgi:phosphoribosylaminoimidazole-succinocarboxamide synthase